MLLNAYIWEKTSVCVVYFVAPKVVLGVPDVTRVITVGFVIAVTAARMTGNTTGGFIGAL